MPIIACSVPGCTGPHCARGWCEMHYQRWYTRGFIEDVPVRGECAECGADMATTGNASDAVRKYCSMDCRRAVNYRKFKESDRYTARLAANKAANANKPLAVIICLQCGEAKEVRKPSTKFCSSKCATRFRRTNHDGSCSEAECHRTAEARGLCIVCWRRWARSTGRETQAAWDERRKANHQRRRALKMKLPADNIRPIDVYERDQWVCGLCALPVDQSAAWPAPLSPSLDHILPLSKGGHHVLSNVQLAHLSCNVRKGANAGYEASAA